MLLLKEFQYNLQISILRREFKSGFEACSFEGKYHKAGHLTLVTAQLCDPFIRGGDRFAVYTGVIRS